MKEFSWGSWNEIRLDQLNSTEVDEHNEVQ